MNTQTTTSSSALKIVDTMNTESALLLDKMTAEEWPLSRFDVELIAAMAATGMSQYRWAVFHAGVVAGLCGHSTENYTGALDVLCRIASIYAVVEEGAPRGLVAVVKPFPVSTKILRIAEVVMHTKNGTFDPNRSSRFQVDPALDESIARETAALTAFFMIFHKHHADSRTLDAEVQPTLQAAVARQGYTMALR